jgi:hypothetical protein
VHRPTLTPAPTRRRFGSRPPHARVLRQNNRPLTLAYSLNSAVLYLLLPLKRPRSNGNTSEQAVLGKERK